jgi:hypothetical protein
VSTWLNAGVPAAEVAERAGHSVEVLTKWSAPEVRVGVIRWWPTPCSG